MWWRRPLGGGAQCGTTSQLAAATAAARIVNMLQCGPNGSDMFTHLRSTTDFISQ